MSSLRSYIVAVLCLSLLAAPLYGHAEEPAKEEQKPAQNHIYEPVTLEKLSRMYWAVSKMDAENDDHIDNFFLINECDIYRDYFHDEFEWKEVRKSGRAFLKESKKTFPLRFEFMQPLRLMDYNFNRKGFEVHDEYKIHPTRRFEVQSIDHEDYVCAKSSRNIKGYPRALVLELSRPFSLAFVRVEEGVAQAYIDDKLKKFRELKQHQQEEWFLYETRDAYLVMKVKIFAYKGNIRSREGLEMANVLAVLEGYDVYDNQDKETLLYSKNYRQRKKISDMEKRLIEEYEASKAAAGEEKMN